MGIHFRGYVAVGIPVSEIGDFVENLKHDFVPDDLDDFDEFDFGQWVYDNWYKTGDKDSISVFKGYPDHDDEDALLGMRIANSEDYGFTEFEYDSNAVKAAKAKFKKITGFDAKVYLGVSGG